jgi:hypothetical protein
MNQNLGNPYEGMNIHENSPNQNPTPSSDRTEQTLQSAKMHRKITHQKK